ncbi:MAG: NAD+ synthase [Chloroflexi bacterium]|nr:NAD+ synthase [Chloroflexota bacterium]
MAIFRVALAQINTTVGDLEGNRAAAAAAINQARDLGAHLVVLPELTITGYPPEDLVLWPSFVERNERQLYELAGSTRGIVAVVGFVHAGANGRLYNAAATIAEGRVIDIYHKIHLPNYGVFDERRYFTPGSGCPVLTVAGVRVGINVCQDIWEPAGPGEVQSSEGGAEILVSLNGSPYEMGKLETRIALVSEYARRNRAYAVYVNQVGGQDELVFDGASMVAGPAGELIALGPSFEETVFAIDLDTGFVARARSSGAPPVPAPAQLAQLGPIRELAVDVPDAGPQLPGLSPPPMHRSSKLERAYKALVTGTRDYIHKTGFKKVAIALSGGIDSTIVAVIAVDALGSENVTGVALPSRYSSEGSVDDAEELARRLGITLWNLPIEAAHRGFEELLDPVFKETEPGLAEENIQSRIRGTTMMAIANKFNWLVLTTGNKSEMATGYATIYGDMAGAFAVIKDVPKTLVYELCGYRNEVGPGSPIPQSVIEKPPSAELRPGQLDQDSLPPYEILDRILDQYVVELLSSDEIVAAEQALGAAGADEATVRRLTRLIDINEYKRRQAPPGVKITPLAFGRDRRLPIANRYRG